jgi:hypothetical protein
MKGIKMAKKSKKSKKSNNTKVILSGIIILLLAGITSIGINISMQTNITGYNSSIEFSNEQIPATIENDKGEIVETDEIPTVEEVDGGLFEDQTTGLSITNGDYDDLGWSEWYPTNTPEAFKNATLGKCIYANNRYGAQCVSLARVYWWSYANRDVSTCGTGMAKGMMNCWQQNAGDNFLVYWKQDSGKIQAGDWLVFDGGQYGHVGMALAPVNNGYVTLLGENQGGGYCNGGGAATNIININIKNLIGYYRPKAYIKVEPKPTPKPTPTQDKCKKREVLKGDTLSKIMKECKGVIVWGSRMNDYANHWYSIKLNKGHSVFYGWTHGSGYGLLAGDIIEYR